MLEGGRSDHAMHVPGGWLQFHGDGTIIRCNAYLEEMLGYTPGELDGRLIGTILTSGARVFCQTHVFPLLKLQGSAEEIYLSLLSKEGVPVPVLLNGMTKDMPEGSSINECLVLRMTRRSKFEDELITAKKKAEMATAEKEQALEGQQATERRLRDQAERLRLATGLVGITVTEIDHENDQVHLSKDAALLFGLGSHEMTKPRATLHATFHPDDREDVLRLIRQNMEPGSDGWFALEHRIMLPDGEVRWISVQVQIYFTPSNGIPHPTEGILVARDITDRRMAMERVKEGETRMRVATEATGVGTWQWHIPADVVKWDAQMFRIFGIPLTEDGVVQRAERDKYIHPEDVEMVRAKLQRRVHEGGTGSHTFRIEHSVAGIRHLEAVETVHEDREGRAEWVYGSTLDTTERVQMEEELRAAHVRKDEFLATLAHELRNPLAPIKSGLQLLEQDGMDEGQQRTIAMMSRQLGHMVRLVDDLMDLSRITRGKIGLRKRAIDLVEVINTAIEANKPMFAQMQHQFGTDLPQGEWNMHGDPVRIAQVVSNLLNNAAKYTPPGGRISCTLRRKEEDAIITIKDNGIGISQEYMASVFDMFAQAPLSKTATGFEGLGIGLNIVKRLVEMHQGEVKGTSPGKDMGSIFTVRLPLSTKPLKAKEVIDGPTTTDRMKIRIMVVDDNEDAAFTMSMLLKRQGHEVKVAYDGENALELGATFEPQLVIMDIGMPKMNGYEACGRMRQTVWGRAAHIVALSGWGQEEDKERSKDAGFDKHLVKPISAQILTQLIAEGQQAPHH